MKMLKLQKWHYILTFAFLAVFPILAILSFFPINGEPIRWDDEIAIIRYILILIGINDFIWIIRICKLLIKEKKHIKKINSILSDIGENAIALKGQILNTEADYRTSKKNGLSLIFGFFSVMLFGIGIFMVRGNYNARTFVLYSNGMYSFEMMKGNKVQIENQYVRYATIKDKGNKLDVELVPLNFQFSVNTQGLDISKEELIAKLKEVFDRPMHNPNQNLQPNTNE